MLPTISRRTPLSLRTLSTIKYCVARQQYSTGSSVHDGDPELLETEKHRNLKKEQHLTSTPHENGAPGWNEYLASTSEAHVKADKYGQPGPPNPELVQQTVKRLHRRYGAKAKTNNSEEAVYEKDEVEGPLKTSATGETIDEYEVKEVRASGTRDKKRNMTRSEEDVKADRNEI